MNTVRIEKAVFIADAFGPMPVWSLKENEDSWFMFVPEDKPSEKMARIRDFFRKLNEMFDRDEVYITGTVVWETEPESEYKVIKDLAVEKVTIYPDGLMETGQPGSRNIGELEK
jgi:hypothetical protein